MREVPEEYAPPIHPLIPPVDEWLAIEAHETEEKGKGSERREKPGRRLFGWCSLLVPVRLRLVAWRIGIGFIPLIVFVFVYFMLTPAPSESPSLMGISNEVAELPLNEFVSYLQQKRNGAAGLSEFTPQPIELSQIILSYTQIKKDRENIRDLSDSVFSTIPLHVSVKIRYSDMVLQAP